MLPLRPSTGDVFLPQVSLSLGTPSLFPSCYTSHFMFLRPPLALATHRNGHGWGNKRCWRGYGHRTCPRRSAGTPLSCLRTSSWRKVRSGHSVPGIIRVWRMPTHMLTGGHLTCRGHGYRGKHDSWLNFIGKCQHRWRQCMKRGWGASAGANFKGMISRRVQDCAQLQCLDLQFCA